MTKRHAHCADDEHDAEYSASSGIVAVICNAL